jgi:hypothetical protein
MNRILTFPEDERWPGGGLWARGTVTIEGRIGRFTEGGPLRHIVEIYSSESPSIAGLIANIDNPGKMLCMPEHAYQAPVSGIECAECGRVDVHPIHII